MSTEQYVNSESNHDDQIENLDEPTTPTTIEAVNKSVESLETQTEQSDRKIDPVKDETERKNEELRKAIEIEVGKLNEKMIKELGMPENPNQFPTLQFLMDMFIFYNQNRRAIDDDTDYLNINMAILIGDRMERLLESANVLYSLSERRFLEEVNRYIDTKVVEEFKLNPPDVIMKRSKIIESIKVAREKEMNAQGRPNIASERYNAVQNPNKKCCSVCFKDPSSNVKLIKVVNSPETNKFICTVCFSKQKKSGHVKYTNVNNGKVYLKGLPKINTK